MGTEDKRSLCWVSVEILVDSFKDLITGKIFVNALSFRNMQKITPMFNTIKQVSNIKKDLLHDRCFLKKLYSVSYWCIPTHSLKRRENSVNLLQQTKVYCSSLPWGKKQQQQMTGEETGDGYSRDITMTYTLISLIWQNTKQNKNITMGRVMASFIAMKPEWRVLYSNLHYRIRIYDQIIIGA